jgi:integrase
MHIDISKPYLHKRGMWRCRLTIRATGARRWGPVGRTAADAQRLAEIMAAEVAAGALTIGEAIEKYLEHEALEGNRASSLAATRAALERFFPEQTALLAKLTKARAEKLYEQLRTLPSERTGAPLAVDSHRNYLAQAKTFCAWCVERGWLRANPLAEVRGVGRRRHGKPQLRIDEARKLRAHALQLAREGDDAGVAVLLALVCGLRASEIVTRTVRDLDDGGRVLWIDETLDPESSASTFQPKTRAGRRPLELPEELQPLLLRRTRDKLPGALLLPAKHGGPHWRDWPAECTRALCKAVGVPVICAHALRGTAATLAVQAGALPHLVAAALGHESTTTTLQSYAMPGSAEAGQRKRARERLK